MIRKILLAGASAAAFSALVSASAADATTLDFWNLPKYTPVTTQYAGVTVSLIGGLGATGPAVTGSFGTYLLGNSPTGDYPTSDILDVAFAAPVKNVSFYFNNFGGSKYGGGDSFVTAFDKNGVVEGQTFVNTLNGGYASVAGSSITDLQFNNNAGSNNWEFGVGEITYTPASGVPEPSTWATLLSGFGFIGYVLRRRVLRAA